MSDAVRIAAFGRSGSGKSTILDAIAAPAARLIAFDYLPTGAKRARRLKLTHTRSILEVRDIIAKRYRTGFRIWYQPPDDQIEALHFLSLLLWRVQERMGDGATGYPHVTLLVDEMSWSFPVTALPADRRGFYKLSTAGRHIGVNLLGASQAPAQVNMEFRRNLNAAYLFSLNSTADQKAVRDMAGRQAQEFCRTTPAFRYCRLGEGGALTFGQTRR